MNINKPKLILVIDPATCTGWCVFTRKCTLVDYGFFKLKTVEYVGDQLIQMMVEVKELIEKFKPYHIVVEDYFFSRRFRQGSNMNPAFRAAIHIIVRLLELPYTIINPIDWKKFVAGRVKPTKEEVKKYGKELSKKVMIRDALVSKYNIIFPDMISDASGKKVKFKYDISDACAMGIYYLKSLGVNS